MSCSLGWGMQTNVCLWPAESHGCLNFLFLAGCWCSMYSSCRLLSAAVISCISFRSHSYVWYPRFVLHLSWCLFPDCVSVLCSMFCTNSHTFHLKPVAVYSLTPAPVSTLEWEFKALSIADSVGFSVLAIFAMCLKVEILVSRIPTWNFFLVLLILNLRNKNSEKNSVLAQTPEIK